jgi:hypothetical protein
MIELLRNRKTASESESVLYSYIGMIGMYGEAGAMLFYERKEKFTGFSSDL